MNFDQTDTRKSREYLAGSTGQIASDALLDGLNPQQVQAVQHHEGPLLILAGAGSGKTRVITHRVAWLVSQLDVHPSSILAITFTNKAAAEMKSRINELIGSVSQTMWIGTFHAMMMRILRRYADRIGYNSDFAILDTDDQHKVVKQCIERCNFDDKTFAFKAVHNQISSAKNALIDPDQYEKEAGGDYYKSRVAKIFSCYQERLKQNNSMDFDDILTEAVRLLHQFPDILASYQERFRYILVDEYQDTNHAQYEIIRLLSAKYKNLCVVGDDDQSIYGFRGANIQNILDFEKDFKKCRVIKLEQNYRSTGHILKAANAVIDHNRGRKKKALWTDLGDGETITFFRGEDQNEEGVYIAREIERQVVLQKTRKYKDFAILYRLNALSRTVEQALREQGVPYRIYGGTRFYDRKEIKDVLAYLRLILVPDDDISLARIINVPRRGIGSVSMDALAAVAARENSSMLAICARSAGYPELQRVAPRLTQFADLIMRLRDGLDQENVRFDAYIDWVENETGLIQDWLDQQERLGRDDVVDRIENLQELISDAVEFDNQMRSWMQMKPEEMLYPEDELIQSLDLHSLLRAFLERAALMTELDQDQSNDDVVRLLTIHSAKGLEFDTVFLVGIEEGLFPGYRSMGSQAEYEEERRLAYVAMTRARRKLFLTTTRTRLVFGQTQRFPVSTFVREIPEMHIEEIGGSRLGDGSRLSAENGGRSHGTDSAAALKKERQTAFSARNLLASAKQNQPVSGVQTESTVPLTPGERVQHPTFGRGKILSSDPVAGDAILIVEFEKAGRKRMLARMSRLIRDR